MAEKITDRNIVNEYVEDAKRYSLYVNRRRSIPDARDGLKPVQRRIIWDAFHDVKCQNKFVKSARVTGSVIGEYHPHGDTAVYDAIKRLVNWFEIPIPYIEGEGNWGNFQGASPAHMRYTEMKLTPFCIDAVLGDIAESPETTDWLPTYNDEGEEPEYLPVKLPMLLIQGNFGIGYGMITNVPKHNINEVIDAMINLIHDPNYDVVLIPDTCMPCDIIETDFASISHLGYGKFVVRGRIDIVREKNKDYLIIKSIPDLTYLNTIIDKIKQMIEAKQLPQISSMEEQSYIDPKTGRDVMKYVIGLRAGSDPNYVKDIIYKNTALQSTSSVKMQIIDNFNPKTVSYKEYLNMFLNMRKTTKIRMAYNHLSKINTELFKTDAFIKYMESGKMNIIDKMINDNSFDDETLAENISQMLGIHKFQVNYILNISKKKCSQYYLNKYKEQIKDLQMKREYYTARITDENIILQDIINELLECKKKYGMPRNSNIISKSEMINIPQGRFKIIVTEKNNIKKVPANASLGSFRDDKPKLVIEGDNAENILIFTNIGKVYKLPIHKIPISASNSNGVQLNQISNKIFGNVISVMYETALEKLTKKRTKYFIAVLTAKGYIKKMDLDDFLAVPPSGIIYSKLEQNDYVKAINIITPNNDIVIYNCTNKALRITGQDIPHLKRSTKGNITFSNIELGKNEVIGMSIMKPDDTDILVITANGKINRLSSLALAVGRRNTTGSKVINLSRGDAIKEILTANDHNTINIQTQLNKYDIPVSDIQFGSSASSGNKIINRNEHIIDCSIY